MMLFEATHSALGTFHRAAAAATSISRAEAPALRRYSCEVRTERLPPVDMSPQARLRRRFSSGGTNSAFTLLHSHSSSSATSSGKAVKLPWPISERAIRTITVASGSIAIQAVISGAPVSARRFGGPSGISNPRASEPPTAATLARNARRSMGALELMAVSGARRRMDRGADALVGAATADIGDSGVDLGV